MVKSLILIGFFLLLSACSKTYIPPENPTSVDKLGEELTVKLDPMQSYTYKESTWTGWNKFWFTSAIGGQAADAITTVNALDGGKCSEGNPILGSNPSTGAVVLLKTGIFGLSYYITEYLYKDKPSQVQARNWIYGVLTVTGFGAAAWNTSQDCE